ncbi:MAG: MmgE/PrpD family protein, partial [Paracoccaceae bacterium]|nr:MmgE/PrpD family protein [Paracoccaceae bacterium]
LRDRVNVVADERLADSAAEVSLVAGGATRMARHDILEDSDPASSEARLRAKAATLLGVGPASDLWARVSNLERAGGLVAFAAQIGGARGDAPPI